jgi:ABC-type phosphate transport system substrate-binding protein
MELQPRDEWVERMTRLVKNAENKRIFFVVGAGLARSPRGDGVWGVSEFLGHLEKEYGITSQGLAAAERYADAMRRLKSTEGPDHLDLVVRRGVLAACRLDASDAAYSGALELDRGIWHPAVEKLVETDDVWSVPPAIKALAQLIKRIRTAPAARKKPPVVLTTNFDTLIETALRASGQHVTSFNMLNHSDFTIGDTIGVLHMHGLWDGMTMHTEGALRVARTSLSTALKQRLEAGVIAVIGYGGWNDLIFDTIAEMIRNHDFEDPPEVIWALHEHEHETQQPQPQRVISRFENPAGHLRSTFYCGVDAHVQLPLVVDRIDGLAPSSKGRPDAEVHSGARPSAAPWTTTLPPRQIVESVPIPRHQPTPASKRRLRLSPAAALRLAPWASFCLALGAASWFSSRAGFHYWHWFASKAGLCFAAVLSLLMVSAWFAAPAGPTRTRVALIHSAPLLVGLLLMPFAPFFVSPTRDADTEVWLIGSSTVGEHFALQLLEHFADFTKAATTSVQHDTDSQRTTVELDVPQGVALLDPKHPDVPPTWNHDVRRVRFVIDALSTGEGFENLAQSRTQGRAANLWMASADIEEFSDYAPLKGTVAAQLFALDGIAIIVKSDRDVSSISPEQLKGIFTGKITTWGALGDKREPQALIRACVRRTAGTTREFESKIGLEQGYLKTPPAALNAVDCGTSSGVVKQVAEDKEGTLLGYVSFAFTSGEPAVKCLSVGPTPTTAVAPDAESIVSHRYRFWRRLQFYTLPTQMDPASNIASTLALLAVDTDAQLRLRRDGFVPIYDVPHPAALAQEKGAGESSLLSYEAVGKQQPAFIVHFGPRDSSPTEWTPADTWARTNCKSKRRVGLFGFTDINGGVAYNLGLSRQRAYMVQDRLFSHKDTDGCDFQIVAASGEGQRNPDTSLELSRRVEAYVVADE